MVPVLRSEYIYATFITSGTSTTVRIPATQILMEPMAPSISPSSSAFAVPTACAEVPSASPRAIG